MWDATRQKNNNARQHEGKCAHTPLMHAIGRTLPFPRASPDPETSGRPTHLSASPGARPLPGGGTPTAVPRQKNKEGGWDAASHNKPICAPLLVSGPPTPPSLRTLVFFQRSAPPGPAHCHACARCGTRGYPPPAAGERSDPSGELRSCLSGSLDAGCRFFFPSPKNAL